MDTANGGRRRRLFRNLGWLFSSQVAIGVIGLVSLAVAARALGPAALGLLAVIEAYSRTVARLVHFEPWQAAIQYGSQALEQGDTDRLSGIFYMSTVVDLAGGLAAGLMALLLAPFVSNLLAAGAPETEMLVLGAVAVFLSLRATGVGVLRLFDRFDILAKTDVASAVCRLSLYLLGFALGLGLKAFIFFFVIVSLLDGILAYMLARREIARRGYAIRPVKVADFRAANPRFFSFIWNSNLAVLFRQLAQRLDVIILAALVSPMALGFYHVARRSSEAALRVGRPLNQAIYPEFTRLAAAGDLAAVRRLATFIFFGLAALLVVILTPVLIHLRALVDFVLGSEFAESTRVIAVQSVAVALFLSGMIFSPAILSLSRDRYIAWLGFTVAAIFFLALFPLVSRFGVVGASYSHLLANSVWLVGSILVVWFVGRVRGVTGEGT